jgi:hypothetical protein
MVAFVQDLCPHNNPPLGQADPRGFAISMMISRGLVCPLVFLLCAASLIADTVIERAVT